MKDYYSKYNSEYSWLIKEEGWVRDIQGVREAQLALGNSFLGSRSVLEELPYDSKPGTYIAGLYDNVGSQVAELVNWPNPFNFKITADGEKLGVVSMDVVEHSRTLNLRHGLLSRHSVFEDTNKKKYDYQSLRFLSMHDRNIGVMQIAFTPLDGPATISIQTGIDTSVYNAGTVTEGRKKHFRVKELGQFENEGYLVMETFGKEHTVIFRSGFYYTTLGKKVFAEDNIFELSLRKNQTVVFTKVFYIDTITKFEKEVHFDKVSEKRFRKAFGSSFDSLLKKHCSAWDNLWNTTEVSIWGDPEVEKNFRFNIYHMLICAPIDEGRSSVGAKSLSGEGYRGHIFWDTEIFLFPFYLYMLPEAAKNILLYRYRRLDAARQLARTSGYKGAMFPWESAGSGRDETPDRAKDLDGKVIKITTGQMEHHITADIAYAFYHYYNATHDEKFLKDYGYEIFFETARFWASRVKYNKRKKIYEIKGVIGPDEFHTDVNNNAFTNMMAKWNLLTASKMFLRLKKANASSYKTLTAKIRLSAKEAAEWKAIAAKICIKTDKNNVIEQFDGYFRKKKVDIGELDENHLPVIPKDLTPRDYDRTQYVKQGDVIMLLYLLSDVFSLKVKKENYEYYISRTLHNSSLSLPMHALMAIEVGDKAMAYSFFNTALHIDISDINNNTPDGIHAACMGGVWQILVNGFAGVRIDKEMLSIAPRLPKLWRKTAFTIHWRQDLLSMEVQNNKVKIRIVSPSSKKKIRIRVFGVVRELSGKKEFIFECRRRGKKA
ncbi:MAG: glycoside hydrolase family 65 protein [Candidatus Omnitrophica bacterium]|nr:glycoside hydrolase family 65 protein [Candidatus Omnitrophota bacterium]